MYLQLYYGDGRNSDQNHSMSLFVVAPLEDILKASCDVMYNVHIVQNLHHKMFCISNSEFCTLLIIPVTENKT